jgi:hypothetical protein
MHRTAPSRNPWTNCPALPHDGHRFRCPKGEAAELRAYLGNMWNTMRQDLEPVFEHCHGYLEKARTAEGFADYIIGCQVETTMPFNDYWSVPLKLPELSITTLLMVTIGSWASFWRRF